ncbi:MAG: glycosyltransferase family 4 protein [Eggerthellaceae bacterium]|jgi:glycosyltransferase involved in cell wall biosynthesis|nr:glycosyltransferase family 4 protein [Eggerthellaceae bacterium]
MNSASQGSASHDDDARPVRGVYMALKTAAAHPECNGVAAKIAAQVNTLDTGEIACDLYTVYGPHSFFGNFFNWFPLLPSTEGWIATESLAANDFLYIRKPLFTRKFIRFLRNMKKLNPNIKIILEIPTYPYDNEMQNIWERVSLARDRHYRKQLSGYVDKIADLSRHNEIFGVETLPIVNGIDLSIHSPRIPSYQDEAVHMLSVSSCFFWHGLDRAITGLGEYYAEKSPVKQVVLHIVGEGPETASLKGMAETLGVSRYVLFHGELQKSEIEELYNQCTIALEGLGYFRKTDAFSSSIKSREYLAKGIPFAYCTDIDVFLEKPVDFCLKVTADDTPLPIGEIVRFHDELYGNNSEQEIIEEIRDYAEHAVSMDAALEQVISYLSER